MENQKDSSRMTGLAAGAASNVVTALVERGVKVRGLGLGELPAQPNGVNRLGSWIGAMGVGGITPADDTPNAEDLLTAEVLGRRVAGFASKMK